MLLLGCRRSVCVALSATPRLCPPLHRTTSSLAANTDAAASPPQQKLGSVPAAGLAPPFTSISPGDMVTIYKELSKAKLSALVVTSTLMGYWMAGGALCDVTLLSTFVGTSLCASSANTCNQIIEKENDKLMKRTCRRPLPTCRISPQAATALAALSGVGGVTLLAVAVNPLTALLGALNIGLYAGVYTPMKTRHPANTWVGAVVGAIPPLMGYSAVFGYLPASSALLALLLYLWQMPHFFALAWLCKQDYAQAGYRMLSVTHPEKVGPVTLRNTLYLYALSAMGPLLDITDWWFAADSALVTSYLLFRYAIPFYRDPTSESARSLFRASLLYLPILMALMVVHRTDDPPPSDSDEPSDCVACRVSPPRQNPHSRDTEGDCVM